MPAARRAFAVLMIAIAALAAACRRTTSSVTHVRLAVGGQAQIVYLAVPLASRLGHFRAEGVEVEIHDFPGGAKSLEALWGGSVDVVCGFYDHTIQMAAEGRALKAFVVMLRYPGFVAVVAPQAAARIRGVKDLAGTTVGVTAPGSSSHLFLNYLLTRHGISPDAVSTTGIGSTATAIAAMTRSRVDAAIMFDPAVSQLRKRAPDLRILADTRTEAGVREWFGADAYPASVLYSTVEWIDRNPDSARRLARAMRRTLRWMHEHAPEEIAATLPPEFRTDDPAVYIDALRASLAMFSPDGQMPPGGPEAVHRALAASREQVRKASVNLAATYTNEFVSE